MIHALWIVIFHCHVTQFIHSNSGYEPSRILAAWTTYGDPGDRNFWTRVFVEAGQLHQGKPAKAKKKPEAKAKSNTKGSGAKAGVIVKRVSVQHSQTDHFRS